ncbi:MAG: hypothetical protein IKU25_03165 [Clostridia bacterium]|nr:hypothetical protein [Clostridia bacterium]
MESYNSGKLYIRKRTLPEWFTVYIFIMPFLLSMFMEFLGVPSFIKYTVDAAWVGIFLILFARKRILLEKKVTPFVVFAGIFLLYVTVVYLFNYQSVFYFLWGVRNNFRFYIAFFAFAIFFEEDDIKSCFKIVDVLFWVNALVSLFQFFAMGYRQDYLGGIFGVGRGCNAYSIVLFVLVVARSVLSYMNGVEKPLLCFLKCATTLLIAAMAELKFYFVIFVLILILSGAFTKFSWRKILIFFIMAIMIMLAGSILTVIFGEGEALTLTRIWELATATSYASTEDMGRFTAIPTVSNRFLLDFPSRMFGKGIGNCDTSAFAICNTPFFEAYSDLRYNWFSSAFLYLEMGVLGLVFNLAFYVITFIFARVCYKRGTSNPLFCQIAMIFAIISIILTFYNASMRKEVAYIAYFAMALPLIAYNPGRTTGEQE